MGISTKGRYGLMAVVELSLHHGEGPVPLKVIAENQGLSEHYLEQLFGPLRRSGIVKSVRGAQGGYLLAKEPAEITVGDILRVLEGPIAPVECAVEGGPVDDDHCSRPEQCIARSVWVKLRESMEAVVDGITLEDLRREAREAAAKQAYMFYI
ncbi:MAG: Rrf2 family transcriptional regulator [Clostridia bacterium]|nr:Rrf2 family transcriptional regulator [Clostridia bacterium]